jgi:cell wall-associated NlpC family hydrolase
MIWVGKQYGGDRPCWAFVEEYYRVELGIQLKLESDGAVSTRRDPNSELVQAELTSWKRVERPMPGDGVLMFYPKMGWHLGIVEDDDHFLHVPTAKTGVTRSRIVGEHMPYIRGFYRHNARS